MPDSQAAEARIEALEAALTPLVYFEGDPSRGYISIFDTIDQYTRRKTPLRLNTTSTISLTVRQLLSARIALEAEQ